MDFENLKSEYLSIITNFGCHYTCPYCIVKNCGIDIPRTTVEGLDKLSEYIAKTDCKWISISGGGDPFYHLDEHIDWWNRLFEIVEEYDDVQLELHTSYLSDTYDEDVSPFRAFGRVVYHCHTPRDLFRIRRDSDQVVRAVYVVTEDFTPEMIDEIAAIAKHHPAIDELSFRQMVDSNYENTHYCEEYLKSGHQKKWWYIPQCDYNVYYAENEVKLRYEDFRRSNKETAGDE